jgi:hypothetical protein
MVNVFRSRGSFVGWNCRIPGLVGDMSNSLTFVVIGLLIIIAISLDHSR